MTSLSTKFVVTYVRRACWSNLCCALAGPWCWSRFEASATQAHFGGMRDRRAESVETGRLHLDILRDLKRVNAHLAAAAYPVLEDRGELLPSRLRHD